MKTDKIRQQINDAVLSEKRSNRLKDVLVNLFRMRRLLLNESQIENVFQFLVEYIQHAPALIDDISTVSKERNIFDQIKHILITAEKYFLEPYDVIPDHLGLTGLIDDAYLTHSLIHSLSEVYYQETGNRLTPVDMTKPNMFVRSLIGEPKASQLDDVIERSVAGNSIQESLSYLCRVGGIMSHSRPDPIWGDADMDQIIHDRFERAGIIP